MACTKCSSGAWVCGPEDPPDCGDSPALAKAPTQWRYDSQQNLTVGTWWVSSEPACKSVTISLTETPGAWELDIDEKGYYIVLCKPGGGGSDPSRVALIKTKTP